MTPKLYVMPTNMSIVPRNDPDACGLDRSYVSTRLSKWPIAILSDDSKRSRECTALCFFVGWVGQRRLRHSHPLRVVSMSTRLLQRGHLVLAEPLSSISFRPHSGQRISIIRCTSSIYNGVVTTAQIVRFLGDVVDRIGLPIPAVARSAHFFILGSVPLDSLDTGIFKGFQYGFVLRV